MVVGMLGRKDKATKLALKSEALPDQISWLADAAMFIDAPRVEAFYDAVFRRDYGEISKTLTQTVKRDTRIAGDFKLGALFPGVFAKGDLGIHAEHGRGRERGEETELERIENPYRHLLALALHYWSDKPGRLVLARTPDEATDGSRKPLPRDWLLPHSDFIRTPPRAMIMLELTPGVKLIPAAVELSNGKVKQLFKDLEAGFAKKATRDAPPFPGSLASPEDRNDYWKWFAEFFNDRVALETVENGAVGYRVRWIAYRFSFSGDDGPYFHMTLSAREAYDTGIFAYNFINRGTKHGLRIVGTLKSEPDIDVLAVFER
jgi:hypothetical protein